VVIGSLRVGQRVTLVGQRVTLVGQRVTSSKGVFGHVSACYETFRERSETYRECVRSVISLDWDRCERYEVGER
jgi:hypothetical protein